MVSIPASYSPVFTRMTPCMPSTRARRSVRAARLASEPRRVTVRVDGRALVDGAQQRLERALLVVRGKPVLGHLGLAALAVAEGGGEPAVQGAAAQPRDVLVDRVADQRVPERG